MHRYEVDAIQSTLFGTWRGVVYRVGDEDGAKVRTKVRSTFRFCANQQSVIRAANRIARSDLGENVETVPLNALHVT